MPQTALTVTCTINSKFIKILRCYGCALRLWSIYLTYAGERLHSNYCWPRMKLFCQNPAVFFSSSFHTKLFSHPARLCEHVVQACVLVRTWKTMWRIFFQWAHPNTDPRLIHWALSLGRVIRTGLDWLHLPCFLGHTDVLQFLFGSVHPERVFLPLFKAAFTRKKPWAEPCYCLWEGFIYMG